jgi:hypothetical protein
LDINRQNEKTRVAAAVPPKNGISKKDIKKAPKWRLVFKKI